MKNIAYLFLLVFASCQCTKTTNDVPVVHQGGVLPDKPEDIAKVRLHVSKDFKDGVFNAPLDARPVKPGKGGDKWAPVFNITSPKSGDSIKGAINITYNYSDNIGVTKIYLTINGALVGLTNGYTSYYWTPPTPGTYSIQGFAQDAAGWTGQSPTVVVTYKTSVIVIPPVVLPPSVELATPPVQIQGGEGSCLAFALGYVRDIEQYYRTGATTFSESTNIFSPEFLYNFQKATTCGSGSFMLSSLNFIMYRGICRWSLLPYSSSNGCDTSIITQEMKTDGLNYRIASYHSILATDQTGIKTALFNKHPLAFTCAPDLGMYNSTCGYIWKSREGALMAGHALTVVGYDDAKRAYKVMNSWGNWSCNGFIWVDYDFFPTITGYCYQMDL